MTEPEDIASLADAVARLVPVGLKVSQREIRDRMGLSEPGEDDDLLRAPAASPEAKPPAEAPPEPKAKRLSAHGAGCACGTCAPLALLLAPGDVPDGIALTDTPAPSPTSAPARSCMCRWASIPGGAAIRGWPA